MRKKNIKVRVKCSYDKCEEVFERTPSKMHETNFCCPEHRGLYNKNQVVITCTCGCGQTKSIRKCEFDRSETHFINKEHRDNYLKNKRVKVKCDWKDCNVIIDKIPSQIKEHNFCCSKHLGLWLTKGLVEAICDECGLPIHRKQWSVDLNSRWCDHLLHKECIPKFQSKQRKGKSYDEVYGSEVSEKKKQSMRKTVKRLIDEGKWVPTINVGKTNPEKVLEKYIQENNLPYKYTGDGSCSIRLEGKLIYPDFVNTNGSKEFIEVLGCYWHKCNVCNKDKNLSGVRSDSIAKTVENDRLKQKLFKQYGYTVKYIWEHEVKDGSFVKYFGGKP